MIIVILCYANFWKIVVVLYEQLRVDYNLCCVVIETCSENVYWVSKTLILSWFLDFRYPLAKYYINKWLSDYVLIVIYVMTVVVVADFYANSNFYSYNYRHENKMLKSASFLRYYRKFCTSNILCILCCTSYLYRELFYIFISQLL